MKVLRSSPGQMTPLNGFAPSWCPLLRLCSETEHDEQPVPGCQASPNDDDELQMSSCLPS
ncbi:hypothetical protein TYRP_019344 [Tyrophagus putrescentiae]|nr:hypothetical protein TYRP_019344 [Tyrophagus putrescentiae]